MKLTREEERALRILCEHNAQELQSRPFRVFNRLVNVGYVRRRPFIERHNGRDWPSFDTSITDAGRAALRGGKTE